MATGSQNMTTYNARTVTGSNSAASPAGALLLSGAGRADDATGDTWLFLDSRGGTSTPWGIKHDQVNNKIHIYGNDIDSVWTRMNTGDTYILGKVGIGYNPEESENSYKLYVNGTSNLNGATSINGTLTTAGAITAAHNSAHLYLKNTQWIKGTTPSSQSWSAVEYISNDASNNRIALLETTLDTSGNSQFNIYLVPNVANSTAWSGIVLKKTSDNVLTVSIAGSTSVTGSVDASTNITAGTYVYASTYLQAKTHIYSDTGHFYMKYNNTWYSVLHNHGNGNISVEAASGGLYIGYSNTTLVNWMNGRMQLKDGCLSIFPNNSSYREGIRIHATGSWSDITLCGNDNTGDSGTSANSWFIGNNNGNFYIARNGSPGSTAYLSCVNNVWHFLNSVTFGARVTSTAPSALTSVDRIIITPYYHTGGPWKITSKDDASNAYLSLYYSTTETARMQHNGTLLLCNNISFTNSGTAFRGINYGTMGDNDQWRIGGAATAANAGYMELATADDGNEPIYVRQYTGVFTTVKRTLTLLDANGYTTLPNRLYFETASDGIYYKGTKATYRTMRFIDNTSGTDGNGVIIGAAGYVGIGSGESGDQTYSGAGYSAGSEVLALSSDGDIRLLPNQQSGYNVAYETLITTNGLWVGQDGNTTREMDIGVRSGAGTMYMWAAASTTGDRGIWLPAHGSGGAKAVFSVNTNNAVTFNGDLKGNAATATTAASCTGNAATATKLATKRTISLTGSVTGSGSFDGSGNLSIATTTNHSHTYIDTHASLAKGSKPSSTIWLLGSWGYETGSGTAVKNRFCGLEGSVDTNGRSTMSLIAYQNTAGSTAANLITVWMDQNGTRGYGVSDAAAFRSAIGAGTSSLTIGTTATTAAAGNHTHTISSVSWPGGQNLTCTPTAANQEYSIDLGNAYTGTYWHVWSAKNSKSILVCYNDNMNVSVPNGTLTAKAFSGPLTGNVTGNCSGSSSSCTGNAATATSASKINIAAGTGSTKYHVIGVPSYAAGAQLVYVSSPVTVNNVGVFNAVWNDYAEYRSSSIVDPGYAINPYGNKTTNRLEAGVRIISDTFGFSVGGDENSIGMVPVGLAGRVLAYPYKNKSEYKIGDAVCSAPGGTVDIMTRDEIKEYPDRIIGIVNEIPDYDIWEPSREGGGREPIHTNGRIWIDVK